MSIDLTKLTPALWQYVYNPQFPGVGAEVIGPNGKIADRTNVKDLKTKGRTCEEAALLPVGYAGISETDAAFIALARNAFDVLMRRGWIVYRDLNGHFCVGMESQLPHGIVRDLPEFMDPFTALVETDAWWAANVEKTKEKS